MDSCGSLWVVCSWVWVVVGHCRSLWVVCSWVWVIVDCCGLFLTLVCTRYLYTSRVYYRACHGWGWQKISKIEVLRLLESGILILVFADILNTPFSYAFFHLLYKNYEAFNLQ